MKKSLFITLLLTCLGGSSLNSASTCDPASIPSEILFELRSPASVKWISEKKSLLVNAFPQSEDPFLILVPSQKIFFMIKKDEKISFEDLENYARRMNRMKKDDESQGELLSRLSEKEKVLTDEKRERLFRTMQRIIKECFGNDLSLTKLSLNNIKIFKAQDFNFSISEIIFQLL